MDVPTLKFVNNYWFATLINEKSIKKIKMFKIDLKTFIIKLLHTYNVHWFYLVFKLDGLVLI